MAEHQDGGLELDAARERARGYGGGGQTSPAEVVALSARGVEVAQQGHWQPGLAFADLAHAAAAGGHAADPGDGGFAQARLIAASNVLEVLHLALVDRGDIRLFLMAQGVADEALGSPAAHTFPELRGLLVMRIAGVLLDAYTASKTPSNYEGDFHAWIARALQAGDPALGELASQPLGAAGRPDPERPAVRWPEPLDALANAERLFRVALELVRPEHRGHVLKGIVDALEWQGMLGGQEDPDELRAVAERALLELAPDDMQARLSVVATLRRLGHVPEGADPIARLEEDWKGYLAETSEAVVWDAADQAAQILQHSDPVRGLALLVRKRELSEAWSDDRRRGLHHQLEATLFANAYGVSVRDAGVGPQLEAAAQRALSASRAADSPAAARDAAAALVGIMLASTRSDGEALGLGLVDALFGLDDSLWAVHKEAAVWLVASLLLGEGANRANSGDFDTAAQLYPRAADMFRQLGLSAAMVQSVDNLHDVVDAGTTKLDELTVWLTTASLAMEIVAPSGAPLAVQRLGTSLLAAQVAGGTSSVVVQLLFQVIAGRRFAAMLAAGTRDFRLTDRVRELLEREAEAEAALPAGSDVLRPAPFDAAFGDDDYVTAWIDEYETGPSETPADRVAGLQRVVERKLAASLVPSELPPVVSLEDITRALDERTALVQLLDGAWTDGSAATYQLLLTRDMERMAVGGEQMPYSAVEAEWRGRRVTMPPSGFYVGSLRKEVQADSTPLDVSGEGERLLASAGHRYLRVVEEALADLEAAGIERLVVVPYGASRFAPLHLAPVGGRLVADRFTVSYLLNVGQLGVEPAAGSRREGAGVFALSYAGQPGLPPLADSADEARVIAEACGTEPILDEEATEPAFAHALQSRRYVHLRAHGRLYPEAPSFHTVFLHPSEGYDGRMRAYEVLPLDLTGLELVTLGACETALGRVDRFDNPRGLPAALLLAGARAVIGTLWPVLASASTAFFTSLYGKLRDGAAVGDAFAAAQRETRQAYPGYRDWGAFYLVGGLGGGPV
ncbi:MAG TPA: CHAT domain-containing protein [Thermoleophilaceae bacterium]